MKKRKCGNKYWEIEQSVEMIFWIGKGLLKKKHRLHLILLIYYPVFKDARKILKELHVLLTPDQGHKIVFSEVPIIGFKNIKSLKDHLVGAVLPQVNREGRSKPCEEANCSCEVRDPVKVLQNLKKQSQKKLLTFLKAVWIVIRTMSYIFLNAKNVSLNSLM